MEYTILTAASRNAEKNGTSQTEEEGKLVEHHQWKIKQIVDALDVERSALQAKAERLQYELDVAKGAISQINGRILNTCEHDLRMLREYMAEAPQYKNNSAGKSFPMAWGRLTFKTQTKAAGAVAVDRDKLAEMYPEYTETKTDVKWGELKKERLEITEQGKVFDKVTGEEISDQVIAGSAKSSNEQYFVEVAGIKFDITGAGEMTDDTDCDAEVRGSDGTEECSDGTAGADGFDPFGFGE